VENVIKIKGTIYFDPPDRTKKHERQGKWKKIAMIKFDGDLCEYYAWFLKKRYNITLHKPQRGAHITFINDRKSDMNGKWEEVKKKWNNKEIEVTINLDPRTDSAESKGRTTYNWWLNIPEEQRDEIHKIREELGLERPFFGLHMTIGRAVNFIPEGKFQDGAARAKEMNVEQSIYIHDLILKGHIRYE
jgi:hypothetical protein